MSRSAELFARALAVTPGGVHSPVRAFTAVGGEPVFIDAADGATLTDADGKRYVDFCMAFGPLILGHRAPAVRAAVDAALDKGWSYGAAEAASLELAELITAHLPWAEQLRFMNSGTEAVMTALRIARGATGRERVLKFDGCYHGHADAMLISAGSGLATHSQPDSAGIPAGVTRDTLIAALDDDDALAQLFADHGDTLAAAIIEPLPANHGLLPQRRAFLVELARLCERHGTVLIFDEVITGFRVGFGGIAGMTGIQPDLVTWGKVIGGGFPVGAVGGRRDLMAQLAPLGPVYQAGTLSANPVAMAAGLATLRALADGRVYAELDALGDRLDQALTGDRRVQRVGSIFWPVPAGAPIIRSRAACPPAWPEAYRELFQRALADGLYLPPSAFEVGFLSAAHTPADLDRLAALLSAVK